MLQGLIINKLIKTAKKQEIYLQQYDRQPEGLSHDSKGVASQQTISSQKALEVLHS